MTCRSLSQMTWSRNPMILDPPDVSLTPASAVTIRSRAASVPGRCQRNFDDKGRQDDGHWRDRIGRHRGQPLRPIWWPTATRSWCTIWTRPPCRRWSAPPPLPMPPESAVRPTSRSCRFRRLMWSPRWPTPGPQRRPAPSSSTSPPDGPADGARARRRAWPVRPPTWWSTPLTGGAIGAERRMLVFMMGGDDEAVARVRPVLDRSAAPASTSAPSGWATR